MSSDWRMAECLEVLRREINAAHPERDKTSDGGIGDAKHASRHSDHNPWVKDNRGQGVVRARDFDEDGIPAEAYVDALVELGRKGDPRLNPGGYVIYEGRIWSSAKGWKERPYTGANAHKRHFHLSVTTCQSGYDSERPWDLRKAPVFSSKAAEKRDRWLGLSNPPMRGQDVVNVQTALQRCGNNIKADGIYGRQTADLIAVFQRNRGIKERGCGPETWKALRAVPRF